MDRIPQPKSDRLPFAVCLSVTIDMGGDYGHINGTTSTYDIPGTSAYPHGLNRYDYADVHALTIYSQASKRFSPADIAHLYAWRLGLESASRNVTLHEAQLMVKTLAPIMRRLYRMERVEGPAATYGVWINRIARAIGATRIWLTVDDDNRGHFEHTGHLYRAYTLGDAVRAIDRAADKMVCRLNPDMAITED